SLNEALNTARAKHIQLSAQKKILDQITTGDPLNDPALELKEGDVIGRLKQSYADQYAKLVEMKGKYLEKHPALVAQEARLETVRAELRHEAQLQTKSTQAQFDLAVETERSLASALEQAKQEALALNKKQIDYDKLRRSADNYAKLYDLVLGRLKESDLAG